MNQSFDAREPEERQLQEIFDETAAHPSEAQVARMLARAEQTARAPRGRGKAWRTLAPLAAAAALVIVVGGAWWARDPARVAPVASTAIDVPTASVPTAEPTAVASADPVDGEESLDLMVDDPAFYPADPLAVLDGEEMDTGVFMSELDMLHGPLDDSEAYWEEMDRLLEEGG